MFGVKAIIWFEIILVKNLALDLEDNQCKITSLVVRRCVCISYEKITHLVKTVKKKLLGKGVRQVVRSNLYKSLVQYSYLLSLFYFCCFLIFFVVLKFVFYFDFILFIYLWLNLCKIVSNKRFFNWKLFFKATQFTPPSSCV